MSQTTPPTVDPLPTPVPQRNSPSNFATRADAFLAQLPTWATQLIALASNVYGNAVDAFNNAVSAAASAAAALVSQTSAAASATAAGTYAGAAMWVSGGSYSQTTPSIVRSPVTGLIYRCILTHTGVGTDPSLDATRWALAATGRPQLIHVTGTTQAMQAFGHYLLENAAATTATLPPSPQYNDIVWVQVENGRFDNVVNNGGNPIRGYSLTEHVTLDDINGPVAFLWDGSKWLTL